MSEAMVVAGLGFGDEGKGTIVDYLTRRHNATLVVRYNGGAQAGHHVVTPDGLAHKFSQFGAGTFHPGCITFLSHYMLFNPLNAIVENDHLVHLGVTDALDRLVIDPGAVIITPYHVYANRIRERLRGANRHGSVGQGVGEARGDQLAGKPTLYARDFRGDYGLLRKLLEIQEWKIADLMEFDDLGMLRSCPEWDLLTTVGSPRELVDPYAAFASMVDEWLYVWNDLSDFRREQPVIFEGAQGVLLDERHGYEPPHVTWTNTTTENALAMLDEVGHDEPVRRIGVTRPYLTRHGHGPLPSERAWLTQEFQDDPQTGNQTDEWQGEFRVGWLDTELLRWALAVSPVDEIALTCLDRVAGRSDWQIAEGQAIVPFDPTADQYRALFEREFGLPLTIESYGPTANDKKEVARV